MKEFSVRMAITMCECAENHAGMQQIGNKHDSGISLDQLKLFADKYSSSGADLTPEGGVIDGVTCEPTGVLVMSNFIDLLCGENMATC